MLLLCESEKLNKDTCIYSVLPKTFVLHLYWEEETIMCILNQNGGWIRELLVKYLFCLWWNFRSSCPEVFCKKGVLKNFAKFTGKYLFQSLFPVSGLRPATLFKKRLWHRCSPVNFANILRTPFSIEHLPWLLLKSKFCIDFF